MSENAAKLRPPADNSATASLRPLSRAKPRPQPDSFGPMPNETTTVTGETRRYVWIIRWLCAVNLVEAGVICVLAAMLYAALELRQIEPYLVTFLDGKQQIVKVEPIRKDYAGINLIAEVEARQYVKLRTEILPTMPEMLRRWTPGGPLEIRSTREVYDRFRAESSKVMRVIQEGKLNRSVIITGSSIVSPGLISVEYMTVDADQTNKETERRNWTAFLTLDFLPQQIAAEKRLENPSGFTVTGYSVQRKE